LRPEKLLKTKIKASHLKLTSGAKKINRSLSPALSKGEGVIGFLWFCSLKRYD
jgi:hypothetical protein